MSKAIIYADWVTADFAESISGRLVGELNSDHIRSAELFRFQYHKQWLQAGGSPIDPELHLYEGDHFSDSQNFRCFLDSCPDRWGRLLMDRREAVHARSEKRQEKKLTEMDYLLGVHDQYRMGGLRYKTDIQGEFKDNHTDLAAPPMASLKELEYAASKIEDQAIDDPQYITWLNQLISPGSSLGGARPKACVIETDQTLWIAKFPNKHDNVDVGAWEYVAYLMAVDCGIDMSISKIKKINGHQHTFLTQRFDRVLHEKITTGEEALRRIHFSSAMTQLAYRDGEAGASYLELCEYLIHYGARTASDLKQLWLRIVFNIAISHSDDHLRNHGFLLSSHGWVLSPAYDINPIPKSTGLNLNINETNNQLDFSLALETIDYYRIEYELAIKIINRVCDVVKNWRSIATHVGISTAEQNAMASCFEVAQHWKSIEGKIKKQPV